MSLVPLWETWCCQSLGVPIPSLLENPRKCPCRQFSFDHHGDHIQTCQRQSPALPAHEWIVYGLSLLLRSVGHRVKTHRITSAAGNERVTSRSRMMSSYHSEKMIGSLLTHSAALTHRVSSTGAPQTDGALNKAARMKIRHYRQISWYVDRPDPIVFLPIAVSTSGRIRV